MNWRQILLGCALAVDSLVARIGKLGGWLMLPLILLIVFDAITRKYFRKLDWVIDNGLHVYMNSSMIQDFEWHLHTVVFFLAIGYAYTRNMHVRLDMFRPRFKPRTRILVELVGGITLLLPFVLVLNFYALDFIASAWKTNEVSSFGTGLGHRWIIKSFVSIGFSLMALICLSMLVRMALFLSGMSAEQTRLSRFTEDRI